MRAAAGQPRSVRRQERRWEQKPPAVVSALGLVIAAYCVWWFFWSGDGFHRHSTNADNRAAVMRLHAALRVGDDFEKVLNEYWSQRTEELRLHVEARDQWFVSMPGEFGASDWTLVVKYHDGKVSAIRVRTADGLRPTDGPADKGSPDA